MKTAFQSLSILLLATALTGQDKIWLTDGSQLKGPIQSFDFKQLVYGRGARQQNIAREKVFKVELGQTKVKKIMRDALKAQTDEEWGTAYQQFMKAGEKLAKNKRYATFEQFAYWNAFQIAIGHGTAADRAECRQALEKANGGKSAFLVDLWRYRIGRSRAAAGSDRKKLTAHKALVARFKTFTEEQGLSERYGIEAELYGIDASVRLREIDAKTAQERLTRLLPRAEGTYPDLANQINLDYANAVLQAGSFSEARKLFTTINDSKVADDLTKARALVGRGHTWFNQTPRSPDNAKKALYDYMRVTILYPEVDVEVVGEALYNAIKAYEAWNGPDKKANVRRLRGRLKIRYADSSWADK